MSPGTDVVGAPDRSDRPHPEGAGTLWLPALLLSVLAILLRILVATRRELPGAPSRRDHGTTGPPG